MELKTWLDDERGRYGALAQRLGVSIARVSQMAVGGVPVRHMKKVRQFTKGAVSIKVMFEQQLAKAEKEGV